MLPACIAIDCKVSHMIGGCSRVVFSNTWSFKTEKRTNLHHDAVSLTMYFLSYCTHVSQVVISGLGLKIMLKYLTCM